MSEWIKWEGGECPVPPDDVPTGTKLYTQPAPAVPKKQEPFGYVDGRGRFFYAADPHYKANNTGMQRVFLHPAPDVPPVNWLADGTPPKYTPGKSSLPSSSIPEGWQLVPKEPTFEMIHAGTPSTEGHYSLPVSLYKSMLASAPKFGEKE